MRAVANAVSQAGLVALVSLLALLAGCHDAHNVDLITGDELDGGLNFDDDPGDGDGDEGDEGDGDGDGDEGGGNGCDPADCADPSPFLSGIAGVEKCCSERGRCGVELDGFCAEYDYPGTPDPSCPGELAMGFFMLDGCCREDGTCGVDASGAGLGCSVPQNGPSGQTCDP